METESNIAEIKDKRNQPSYSGGDGFDFATKAFEGASVKVKFMPPYMPGMKKKKALEADINPFAMGGDDIEAYQDAVDNAAFARERVTFLNKELANISDIGNPDDLENEPGSEEAVKLREAITFWKSRSSVMDRSIDDVILKCVTAWNGTLEGNPIPLNRKAIKEANIPLIIITGFAAAIIAKVMGSDNQGKGQTGATQQRR